MHVHVRGFLTGCVAGVLVAGVGAATAATHHDRRPFAPLHNQHTTVAPPVTDLNRAWTPKVAEMWLPYRNFDGHRQCYIDVGPTSYIWCRKPYTYLTSS